MNKENNNKDIKICKCVKVDSNEDLTPSYPHPL